MITFATLTLATAFGAPAIPTAGVPTPQATPLSAWTMAPTRVVWTSPAGAIHAANLLGPKSGQALLKNPVAPCVLAPAVKGAPGGGILLDKDKAAEALSDVVWDWANNPYGLAL